MSAGRDKEAGQPPREIRYIVIHHHKGNQGGDALPFYHFYIEDDGYICQHLSLREQGRHTPGFNRCSVGIYLRDGKLKRRQYVALQDLTDILLRVFPEAVIVNEKQLKAYG